MTLSDLSAGTDGRTICPFQYKSERPPDFQLCRSWPRQVSPTPSQARLWSTYVSTSFLRYRLYWTSALGHRLPPTSSGSTSNMLSTPSAPSEYPHLKSFLTAIPSFYRRLLSHYDQCATDLEVWRAFRDKRSRLEIVTDGSLADGIGTFGWRLLRPPTLVLFQGSGPVNGPIELATSTRSELGGFAAPLLLVAAISKFWGLRHRCKFRWIVDST
jgi:hypothetical protein